METERLILRAWREEDAPGLYKYASDPEVGPPAGWEPHSSVENSLEIIRNVFSMPDVYAVVLKGTDEPVGCCGLVPSEMKNSDRIKDDESEIGYWIGKPYWGNGLIPEAVGAIVDYAINILNKTGVWISFSEENDKSRRVAEKCGFEYSHSENDGSKINHFIIKVDNGQCLGA